MRRRTAKPSLTMRPLTIGITVTALLATCSLSFQPQSSLRIRTNKQTLPSTRACVNQSLRSGATPLFAAPSPLPDTTDPFVLLGLDPTNPTADKREIKRAYKRQAMRYHPDVVVNTESSPEERRRASEEFAKINAAYEMLSGKGSGDVGVGSSKGRKSSSGTSGGSGSWAYQPPHRRTSSGSSSYTGRGTGTSSDWRDYMPNYDEEDSKYSAGDDSFSKIFSDLMTGVAAGAVGAAAGVRGSGGGGILNDLVEFLEGVDGYASGSYEDDSTLSELLAFGSLDDVSNEMDDTQLLVEQLGTKIENMDKDIVMIQEEVRRSMYEYSKYVEKIELEERLAEIEARKGVVRNYLKKARKRLVKLQSRYKELIVAGRSDSRAGTGGYYSGSASRTSSGSRGSYRDAQTTGRSSSSSYASDTSSVRGQAPSPSSSPTSKASTSEENSQSFSRTEGFGSFGRRGGRGSGRGRRRSSGADSQTTTQSPNPTATPINDIPSPTYAPTPRSPSSQSYRPSPAPSPSSRSSTSTSSSRSSSITQNNEWSPPVPPHRRTGPDPRQVADDLKRLRDIKVDDEFDKLKKELGL